MRIKEILKKDSKYLWLICVIGITIIAFIRFFYTINGDYFTFLDEYITFDTAAGFTHTGRFYRWDFHYAVLTDQEYTRAWPHTVLLSGWFKVFGISVVAGKMLSASLGVLFILSLFYITKKIYQHCFISVFSCLIVMTNTTVVTVFRQIRMYSLWLFLMVWLTYFFYQALIACSPQHIQLKSDRKIKIYIHNYFNFSMKYIILSVLFLMLGYFTHINTLGIGVGVFLFLIYCMLVKRENRYYFAVIALTLLIIIGALIVKWLIAVSPELENIYWWIISSGNIGIREDINSRYWYWVVDFVHSHRFFWFSVICLLIAFGKKIITRDNAYDFSVYLFLTAGSSLICFIYFLTRYYQARYIIYIAPMISILMAWGIFETFSIKQIRWMMPVVAIGSIIVLGVNIVQTYADVYNNSTICHHREVYEILKRDAEIEIGENIIPIVGYDFQDYYGVQILDDYTVASLDRENDMKILKEFAKSYPNGYILVETAKINGFPDAIKNFIQSYSERIAGEGEDDYNIEMIRYHFVNPVSGNLILDQESRCQNGPVTYSYEQDGEETRVKIKVDMSMLGDNTDTLFIKLGIFTYDKETEDKCYQLCIPEQYTNNILYYEITMKKACQVVLLKDECMLYYTDGSCREKLLYEK